MVESIQDINFRFGILTKAQLWPLKIKKCILIFDCNNKVVPVIGLMLLVSRHSRFFSNTKKQGQIYMQSSSQKSAHKSVHKFGPQVSPQVGLQNGKQVGPQVGPQVSPQVGPKVTATVDLQVGLHDCTVKDYRHCIGTYRHFHLLKGKCF